MEIAKHTVIGEDVTITTTKVNDGYKVEARYNKDGASIVLWEGDNEIFARQIHEGAVEHSATRVMKANPTLRKRLGITAGMLVKAGEPGKEMNEEFVESTFYDMGNVVKKYKKRANLTKEEALAAIERLKNSILNGEFDDPKHWTK